MAGIWQTVVNVRLAVSAGVTGFTVAFVASVSVLAQSTVSARVFHTFIDVNLTGLPLPSHRTYAGEAFIVFRLLTSSSILTWADTTRCQNVFTCFPSIGEQANALESSNPIYACPLV